MDSTTDVDAISHELVLVDEFDALNIEVPELTKHTLYPARTHAQRVVRELGVKSGIIYLPGELEKEYEDSDFGPPFRQRRYFYYITGANFPKCRVTYDIAADELILWIPTPSPSLILWYGRTPSIKDCKNKTDVDDVRPLDDFEDYLGQAVTNAGTLYVLRASQIPPVMGSVMRRRPDTHRYSSPDYPDRLSKIQINTSSLKPAMDEARVTKTPHEIALIRRANLISSRAHDAIARNLHRFTSEAQIQALFTSMCIAANAHSQAYPVIAGSGRNAATLHYDADDEPLEGKQLVVVDAGCEWECYASDITRTLPIDGKFSAEAEAIYKLVERMQEACISRIKPGVIYYNLHKLACEIAVHGLMDLGILHNGTKKQILQSGVVTAFFPHGLGHHVGLEVHDVPGRERLLMSPTKTCQKRAPVPHSFAIDMWKDGSCLLPADDDEDDLDHVAQSMLPTGDMAESLGSVSGKPYLGTRRLEPFMVVTVEPGIYFCREFIEGFYLNRPEVARFIDIEVLERYWGVGGVRIEDDILVTGRGYENLTTAAKGSELFDLLGKSRA